CQLRSEAVLLGVTSPKAIARLPTTTAVVSPSYLSVVTALDLSQYEFRFHSCVLALSILSNPRHPLAKLFLSLRAKELSMSQVKEATPRRPTLSSGTQP